MPIEFRCGACQTLLRVGDEFAGRQAKCPTCGVVMTVPAASPSPVVPGAEATSPFGTAVPFSPTTDNANPYQSPQFDAAWTAAPGTDPYYASSRVQGPAIGLMIVGGLGIAVRALGLAAFFLLPQLMREAGNQNVQFTVVPESGRVVMEAVALLMGILVIYGAVRMKNLENYSWARTASILGMLPCIGPCCLLGLPIGIWALVVLSNSHVKAAFQS